MGLAVLLALVVCGLGFGIRPASAQDTPTGGSEEAEPGAPEGSTDSSPPSSEELERAGVLIEQARLAAEAGRAAEATDLLRLSLQVAPTTRAAFNLAVTLQGVGAVQESIGLLTSLLEGRYGDLSDQQRRNVRARRVAVTASLGTLQILVSGAEWFQLRVDGQRVEDARPNEAIEVQVDPGEHLISADGAGMEPFEERAQVRAGETLEVRVAFELLEPPGRLVVRAPDDQELVVEGVGRARGRLEESVRPGSYDILLADGSERQRVQVDSGETVEVSLGESGGLFAEPVFWITLGVVVAAGAVTGAVLLSDDGGGNTPDGLLGTATTLRFE